MSDENAGCAHLDVGFLPVQHPGGEESDSWRCAACGREFMPTPIGLDLSRMTLGELEATAERMGKAVATIREAQSLLGAPQTKSTSRPPPESDAMADDEAPPRPLAPVDAVAAHRARQFQPVDADVPRELRMPKPERPRFSASEQSQRAGLLGQFSKPVDPALPDDIAAMERQE